MANAKRTPGKGIIGEGKIFFRRGPHSNRLYFTMKVSKEDEVRLLEMLLKRHPKMGAAA